MMTHSLIRIESFSMGKIGTKYNDQSDTYFTKSCKGSPNGMTRMVSVALITMSCKKNDIVAVELRKREGNRHSCKKPSRCENQKGE